MKKLQKLYARMAEVTTEETLDDVFARAMISIAQEYIREKDWFEKKALKEQLLDTALTFGDLVEALEVDD